MAMEWVLRCCRAKSLMEELVMMTLMPEAAISLIILLNERQLSITGAFGKGQGKGGGIVRKTPAPSPNVPPPRFGQYQVRM